MDALGSRTSSEHENIYEFSLPEGRDTQKLIQPDPSTSYIVLKALTVSTAVVVRGFQTPHPLLHSLVVYVLDEGGQVTAKSKVSEEDGMLAKELLLPPSKSLTITGKVSGPWTVGLTDFPQQASEGDVEWSGRVVCLSGYPATLLFSPLPSPNAVVNGLKELGLSALRYALRHGQKGKKNFK